MAQQGPSAWPSWTNTDNMHRNALSEETEPSITIWVAISFTMPVAKRAQIATKSDGVAVTGISLQLNGRFGPGLDMLLRKLAVYKRAFSKAAGRDGGRPLQEWQKLLNIALARYAAATFLFSTGHKAH